MRQVDTRDLPSSSTTEPSAFADPQFMALQSYWAAEPTIRLDAREAVYETLDPDLIDERLARAIIEKYGSLDLYRHQTRMLTNTLQGGSGVLTTGTNSGKSDVFILTALDLLLTVPEARVLVLYPSRALNIDQMDKWHDWIRRAGLSPDILARIDGTVPRGERTSLLKNSRILMTTPDAFHAWFMPEAMTHELYRDFMQNISLRIIDELHAFSGVFGTNAMHMLRRLDYHQSRLHPRYNPRAHRRYLAASGTLHQPEQFFERLTGVPGLHIGEDMNGAPQQVKDILHIDAHPNQLIDHLFNRYRFDLDAHQMVIFADSLVRIEDIANEIKTLAQRTYGWTDPHSVLAYKSGLPPADYTRMHEAITTNRARVIVSSSALEMGVDAPHLDMCFQIGVPRDLSSWMQRIGRTGRRKPSLAVLVNPDRGIRFVPREGGVPHPHPLYAWMRQGVSNTPVLHPANMPLQLASAFCLKLEQKGLEPFYKRDKSSVVFPKGFGLALSATNDPYASIDESVHYLIPKGRQRKFPHSAFPLRSVPGPRFDLVERKGQAEIMAGSTSAHVAITQFTPGMITRHRGERFRVMRWEEDSEQGATKIILYPYKGYNRTKSYHATQASLYLGERMILGPTILGQSSHGPVDGGFMARLRGTARLTTKGFIEYAQTSDGTQKVYPYRYMDDYQLEAVDKIRGEEGIDYGPRRHLETPTAGILLHVPENWFGLRAREELGRLIADEYCRRHAIHPSDIHILADHVRLSTGSGRTIDHHALFLYEASAGGIGLLNWLPDEMRTILKTLREQNHLDLAQCPSESYERHELMLRGDRLDKLLRSVARMKPIATADLKEHFDAVAAAETLDIPEGYIPVFGPGDIIRRKTHGNIEAHAKVLVPGLSPIDGTPGYYVRQVDRRRYYEHSGRWVSVRKGAGAAEFTLKELQISEEEKRRTLGKHFLPASVITTPLRHPLMVMSTETGHLYSVDREEEGINLVPFDPQGDTRLLYEEVIRAKP